jgi:DNA-3-methyladenine glycosylase
MPVRAGKLARSFYARETLLVARDLLGMHLVHAGPAGRQVGRIVEAEAYRGPHDLAAHSSRGRTERTDVMFGPPGHAYVYLIYGFWNCLNVVTAADGVPHAVLIRALEPVAGIDNTTHGPGLLCRAMHIDRSLNRVSLTGDNLWIERPERHRPPRVARSARIGVDYAGDWASKPWRFFDRDSPYVSTVSAAARRKALAAAEAPVVANGGKPKAAPIDRGDVGRPRRARRPI